MAATVSAAYLPIKRLSDLPPRPPSIVDLHYRPVDLQQVGGQLRLAGAWTIEASDRRLTGLSGLAIDGGQLLAVGDRGAVVRLDFPSAARPRAWIADLRHGPGHWGERWARDAESLAPDHDGRGWWVGYEQNHSLWLYDEGFNGAVASLSLDRDDWRDNRGAEGLLVEGDHLLVTAENGREAVEVGAGSSRTVPLDASADIAEAARAPDGSAWLLLRSKGLSGVTQSIAPLVRTANGYRTGPAWPVPKGAFDNYEGMAIEPRPGGGLRFWLVSDDGHRIMARTLLVALDYVPGKHESPAQGAGLSKN